MKRGDWLLGLFTGLLIGWIFLPTPLGICGIYQSASAPAWVQAIGSVVAILVAAAIPIWQARAASKEQGRRLSIATLRLRSNLEALARTTGERFDRVRNFESDSSANEIENLMFNLNPWEVASVELQIDKIHHLDERIQKPILDLLQENDQYVIDVERIRTSPTKTRVEEFKLLKPTLVARLESVMRRSFNAANAIRKVEEEAKYPDIRKRRKEALRARHD
jgi:hypothetical protein